MTPLRCACIDIGSNTTRLLVAEMDPDRPGALVEVAAHRAFVRLTAHERRSGLAPEKLQAIAEAVAEQALTARANDIAALRVVATAALRDAPGRDALLAQLSNAAGVPVEVLSGEDEARLAFSGATATLEGTTARVVVADVGGGSTELAAGAPGQRPSWWASIAIGSGGLADAHLHDDPPTLGQLSAARAEAAAAIAAVGCPGADVAWAVGGSATSLRRLCGGHLTAEALDAALARVVALPAAHAALELDLHIERVRLLPAGLILLAEVARAAGCPLHIGSGGLREGVVLDLFAQVG
ncbi:MAG: exopolyphosphatase / guanosine-5-triphosphate,3-diphosphate pyrophosphatase [Baekduia sp.]|nr:exopolyphosphatase / guanosine-5-triphosphate,3-diphosphate pyrophosphatase [Baekduia sp.]